MTKVEQLQDYLRRTHRFIGGATLGQDPAEAEIIAGEILASLIEYDEALLAAQEKRYGP